LDTKIHIPIISDILNAIGVPEISFLDLFTWIGAAGITIVYKIGRGKAPFADDATSRALIQAQDWDSFSAVLKQQSPAPIALFSSASSLEADKWSSNVWLEYFPLHRCCHIQCWSRYRRVHRLCR
jgi:hypothetical protein